MSLPETVGWAKGAVFYQIFPIALKMGSQSTFQKTLPPGVRSQQEDPGWGAIFRESPSEWIT